MRNRIVFLYALLAFATPLTSQRSKPTKDDPAAGQAQLSHEAQARFSSLEKRIASTVARQADEDGDSIPCIFTKKELLGLRAEPVSPRLSSVEEEALKSAVISEALAQDQEGNIVKETFVAALAKEPLVGLTPSQALARIILLLQAAKSESVQDLVKAASAPSKDELPGVVSKQVAFISKLTSSQTLMLQNKISVDDLLLPKERLKAVLQKLDALSEDTSWMLALDKDKKLSETKEKLAVGILPVEQGLHQALNALTPNPLDKSIVDKARKVSSAFKRPTDVGCSMSILDWNETRYAFGRMLANEYIAVQVTVRNLNRDEDFILHDVELAVDSDPNGRYGRFLSGRDKIIVRALSREQQDFGRRNVIVHIAEGIGNLASAAVPVLGESLTIATGVYNSGFLPGLGKAYPDHSVDHMNLVSDVGFSSSMTYKTVVPKTGSVLFVSFIPSKQFEDGWWTQNCARIIALEDRTQDKSTGLADQSGVDVHAAIEHCRQSPGVGPKQLIRRTGTDGSPTQSPPNDQSDQDKANGTLYLKPQRVSYKKWNPTSLALFRELAFVVVSGTHIQEQTQLNPVISQLECPETETGDLDFLKATGDALNCKLTGQNLDRVSNVRLRNSKDALDTKTVDGSVTVSGDSASGTVAFKLDDLGALTAPAYNAYSVTKAGLETDSQQVVHLNLRPFVRSLAPPTIDPSDAGFATQVIHLTGYHLDALNQLTFKETAASISVTPDGVSKASFKFSNWSDFKTKFWKSENSVLPLQLKAKEAAVGLIDTNLTLTVKGKPAPAQANGSQSGTDNSAPAPGTNAAPPPPKKPSARAGPR